MGEQIGMIPGYRPEDIPKPERGRKRHETPIGMFGLGPEGKVCGTCAHHVRYRRSKVYHKCVKWYVSGSAATDIRLSWRACGRYEELVGEPKEYVGR